jgi:hypothetical protein
MDHIWRREAEREMARRFTTPLLPLKLVEGNPSPAQMQSQHSRTNASKAPSSIRGAKPDRALAKNTQQRTNQATFSAHLQQTTASHVTTQPQTSSDTNCRDVGPGLPATPLDRSTMDSFIQDLNQDFINRRLVTEPHTRKSQTQPISQDQLDVRDKIARSAAAFEDSLAFHLGNKRTQTGVRFQEPPDARS